MITAVLFDMDGVLVDSEPHWKQYWKETVFTQVLDGAPTLEDVTGRNFRESLVYLEEEYGLPGGPGAFEPEVEAFADEMYRNDATVTDGMPELFELLRRKGIDLGIVSSSAPRWISGVTERSGLGDLDIIVSAEEVDAPGKPHPAVYEHALDQLGVDPDDCVVIEDSKNGARAAHRAGTTVIRYQADHETEPIPAADYIAKEIEELETKLLQLIENE